MTEIMIFELPPLSRYKIRGLNTSCISKTPPIHLHAKMTNIKHFMKVIFYLVKQPLQ